MDALMPLATLPVQISGRNRMMRRMVIDSIKNDPEWNNGDYKQQPARGLTSAIYTLLFMTSVPLQQYKQAPTRDAADKMFDNLVRAPRPRRLPPVPRRPRRPVTHVGHHRHDPLAIVAHPRPPTRLSPRHLRAVCRTPGPTRRSPPPGSPSRRHATPPAAPQPPPLHQ